MTPTPGPDPGTAQGEAIRARLELPCGLLDLQPPPVVVTLRLRERDDGWSIVLLSEDGAVGQVRSWIDHHESLASATDTIVRGSTLSIALDRLPERLGSLTERVHLERLVVEPDGTARLALRGQRARLRELIDAFPGDDEPEVRSVTQAEEGTPSQVLTARQLEVLMRASGRGYYDVPRHISLRELAKELDMSPAALSELLRRTEARLVEAFLEALSTSPEMPLEALAVEERLPGPDAQGR